MQSFKQEQEHEFQARACQGNQVDSTNCGTQTEIAFFTKWAEQLGKLVGKYLANAEFKSKQDHRH